MTSEQRARVEKWRDTWLTDAEAIRERAANAKFESTRLGELKQAADTQADADALSALLAERDRLARLWDLLENYYPAAADSTEGIYQREAVPATRRE